MIDRLILATSNKGKVVELKRMLPDFVIETADEHGLDISKNVEEDQKTFEGNALKKARYVWESLHTWCIADDSGMCIDALDGGPGVLSARWAGEHATNDDLVTFTLEKMKGITESERSASFVSSIAIISPDGEEHVFTGKIKGIITKERRGTPREHLMYDLIFQPEGGTKTFSELSSDEKNSLSHRGKALRQATEFLLNQ